MPAGLLVRIRQVMRVLTLIVAVAVALVAGLLAAIPRPGLVYLGTFALVGGLVFLISPVRRWLHDGEIRDLENPQRALTRIVHQTGAAPLVGAA